MIGLDDRLEFARELADEAGRMARDMRQTGRANLVEIKDLGDFATYADRDVERHIRTAIATAFPDDGIVGEEYGAEGVSECNWFVDPIDGTTNYARGLPEWGVSIACTRGAETIVGAIALPDLSLTAWAAKGQGAWIGDQSLRMADLPSLPTMLAILGYSRRTEWRRYRSLISALNERDVEYRRQGAACFGLVSVAAGWADLYYEEHLNSWDALAGLLLVSEAGGCSDFPPLESFQSKGGRVIAARNKETQADFLELLLR